MQRVTSTIKFHCLSFTAKNVNHENNSQLICTHKMKLWIIFSNLNTLFIWYQNMATKQFQTASLHNDFPYLQHLQEYLLIYIRYYKFVAIKNTLCTWQYIVKPYKCNGTQISSFLPLLAFSVLVLQHISWAASMGQILLENLSFGR